MSRSYKDARGGHAPGPGVGYAIHVDLDAVRNDWREIDTPNSKRFWKRFKHRLIRQEERRIIKDYDE